MKIIEKLISLDERDVSLKIIKYFLDNNRFVSYRDLRNHVNKSFPIVMSRVQSFMKEGMLIETIGKYNMGFHGKATRERKVWKLRRNHPLIKFLNKEI